MILTIATEISENMSTTEKETRAMAQAARLQAEEKVTARKQGEAEPVVVTNGESVAGDEDVSQAQAEPITVSVIGTHMGIRKSWLCSVTFRELLNSTRYAKDLYASQLPDGHEDIGKKPEQIEANLHIFERYQRAIDMKRVREIADYLLANDDRYFPPILCIPANNQMLDVLTKLNGNANGNQTASITIPPHWLLIIDGQHRTAAIDYVLKLLVSLRERLARVLADGGQGEAVEEIGGQLRHFSDMSEIPNLENERIGIQITAVDPTDTAERHTLFGDVNKNPKRTNKAQNLAFEERSEPVLLAKQVAMRRRETGETAGSVRLTAPVISQYIDFDRSTPKKSKSGAKGYTQHILSFSNLCTLIQVERKTRGKFDCAFTGKYSRQLSVQETGRVIDAVVFNLPEFTQVRDAHKGFGDISEDYVVYHSVAYQALGRVIYDYLMAITDNQVRDSWAFSVDEVVVIIRETMRRMNREGLWNSEHENWNDPNHRVVVLDKGKYKVLTQRGNFEQCVYWLREYFKQTTPLPMVLDSDDDELFDDSENGSADDSLAEEAGAN